MEEQNYRKIIAGKRAGDLVGRSGEMDRLTSLSEGSTAAIVAGAPGTGVTELLKQTYDRLFSRRSEIIPFYFALNSSGESTEQTARRFLHQFLLQTVAFRRGDESILNWFPDIWELGELALPADGHWVDRLVSKFGSLQPSIDEEALIRTCLSAPRRAAATGARIFMMIDNAHAAESSEAAGTVLSELGNIYRGSGLPLVVAGHRRFNFNSFAEQRIAIEALAFADTAKVAENNAAEFKVAVNDETSDLIASQLGANLEFIRFIFQSAAERNESLDSFMAVERAYAEEIFGGRVQRFYDAVIDLIAPGEDRQRSIISLLDVGMTIGAKQLSVESWLKRLAVKEGEFDRIIQLLNTHELIRVTAGRVEAMDGNLALTDYISSRFRLEVAGENRAGLFGQCVASYLKRAPRIMAAYYRQLAAVGLRELLTKFSLQQVPLAVLDYGVYTDRFKGLPEEEIIAGYAADKELVQLPQIVYTANAADLYKPIAELSEKDRTAVALGFQEGKYSDEDEIVWVVAELDSKLEATRELAEFWCDRLEMTALICNFSKYKIWLIAPEGFAPDALELLLQRDAFGSSRRQVEHLRRLLSGSGHSSQPDALGEYEIVVPMDDESEMIAARTLEEIARRHNIPAKAINQIKTALLEASINASEHSLSPDRRIRQKFRVHDDRIIVTISNRGLRLADRKAEADLESGAPERAVRRGWGLKLIEKLMDEVKIEQTDDGTSISMTKYIREELLVQPAG